MRETRIKLAEKMKNELKLAVSIRMILDTFKPVAERYGALMDLAFENYPELLNPDVTSQQILEKARPFEDQELLRLMKHAYQAIGCAANLTEETKRKYVEDFAFIDAISGWSKNDNMIRKKIVKVQ